MNFADIFAIVNKILFFQVEYLYYTEDEDNRPWKICHLDTILFQCNISTNRCYFKNDFLCNFLLYYFRERLTLRTIGLEDFGLVLGVISEEVDATQATVGTV